MRFHAAAFDFDGTLATEGVVPPGVIEALERLKRSGRTLILVTGRIQEGFVDAFPAIRLFSRVILENGAVMYRPETGEVDVLARRPPPELLRRLKERGVPVVGGKVIVATCTPHDAAVLEIIRDLGLEMHLVFNKGAVMALPSGVNKATGLEAALKDLRLSFHHVVGVGDAENDHAFLERCGCAVAVANALPSLKEKVDWVTPSAEGAGVVELVRRLLADELAGLEPRRRRRKVAEGDLGPDMSFYFRGPEGKLNLRAQNLRVFLQMAAGVDDGTWQFHLRRGDYSRWFRDAIKDVGLSTLAREVEASSAPPAESRAMIRKLVEDQYTSPV